MKSLLLLTTLVALPLALASAADESTPAPAKGNADAARVFKNMDLDGDGAISFAEYKAGTVGQIDRSRVADVFRKKDADGDGKLTLAELLYVPQREDAKPAGAPAAKKEKKDKKADAAK
jgi:Ca2+-binding EF-hand superfamily protein